jgi:hypothetical protein
MLYDSDNDSLNPLPANVENIVPNYASKWPMGFNSAFIGLI